MDDPLLFLDWSLPDIFNKILHELFDRLRVMGDQLIKMRVFLFIIEFLAIQYFL